MVVALHFLPQMWLYSELSPRIECGGYSFFSIRFQRDLLFANKK